MPEPPTHAPEQEDQHRGPTGGSAHWDRVYTATPPDAVSWYERGPTTSLRLITTYAAGLTANIIDVGAGESSLVDQLLDRGFNRITVLDVSAVALAQLTERLGGLASRVARIHTDVLTWEPDDSYDLWHDRAVFHFLTARADRDRYVAIASSAVRSGSFLVIATLAEDGPLRCSGLPVSRYAATDLAAEFAPSFALVHHEREEHMTPAGAIQPFTWAVLRRVAEHP